MMITTSVDQWLIADENMVDLTSIPTKLPLFSENILVYRFIVINQLYADI